VVHSRPTTISSLVVIGLDGASFNVIDALIAEGKLPHIQSLLERGTRASVLSPLPLGHSSAWVTLVTGKHPGAHGIYASHQREGYVEREINSADVRVGALWDILSAAGLRVAVAGVPATYPPRPINGVMVSGGPAPPGLHVSPAEDAQDLSHAAPGYPFSASLAGWATVFRGGGPAAIARHLALSFDHSLGAALHLWRREAWSLFLWAFGELKRAQRFLPWPDNGSDAAAVERRRLVARCYAKADQVVGRIASAAGPRATIALVSPFGLGENHGIFYANRWLADQGWLAVRPNAHMRLRAVRATVDEALGALGFELGGLLGALPVCLPRRVSSPTWELIDWRRTRAFAAAPDTCGIRLNLRGREPQGVVEPGAEYEETRSALITSLKQVRDAGTGGPMISWAGRREEVFDGPCLDGAPDIVYLTRDNARPASDRLDIAPAFARHAAECAGGPRFAGALILAGPAARRGAILNECRIVDLAPTLLRILGAPVPAHLGGEVLTAALDAGYLDSQRVKPSAESPSPEPTEYSPDEQRALEERLRSHGCM
jgi:predicted AlkP superfamily phosphohydrolase/phosphomutase